MSDQNKASLYRERQVLTASPLERIVIVYDVALTGCAAGDNEKALRALSLLRGALDWEAAPEIAPRLQALYEFCEECIRRGDYDTPADILRELRGAWAQASRQMAPTSTLGAKRVSANDAPVVGVGALSLAG